MFPLLISFPCRYSSNADISRARGAFFSGKKSFLLVSERFHFFRRYALRGVRNILFYAPPEHPQFYAEVLQWPFLDPNADVEAGDVVVRTLWSRLDAMALERIVGSKEAGRMIVS
jgi:U3 small nucleolar RNA-associated protein 25